MRRYTIPCPSPRGTNHERLYIVREPMALDAAMPDDDAGAQPDDGAFEDLMRFVQDKIDPGALGQFEELLTRLLGKTDVTQDDEPSAISGRPGAAQSPTTMSMDADLRRRVAVSAQIRARRTLAHHADFNKRFPAASRIRSI
jgi:hypothetical protein